MNNIFDTLFGTPVRTVASLIVVVGLLTFTYQGSGSKIAVSINENFAAGANMALAADNAIIKAQCFGGKNARIFVSWNSNKGAIQKQIDGGPWTYLGSAGPRTHYADWTVALGHTYAYRLRKPPASTAGAKYTFSNIATVKTTTAAACTSLPVATVTNTTHASAFFTSDTINVSVIGEPNRPVQSCSKFIAAGSSASVVSCVPKTPTFDTRTSPDGTWTQTLTIGSNAVGAWTRYFIIAGKKSNEVKYTVANIPVVLTSLQPMTGPVGTTVTITGSGFTPTGNKIKFGNLGSENNPVYNLPSSDGVTIAFAVPTSNYLACWTSNLPCMAPVQATQPGTYGVSVMNSNGTSNEMSFDVTAVSEISQGLNDSVFTVSEPATQGITFLDAAVTTLTIINVDTEATETITTDGTAVFEIHLDPGMYHVCPSDPQAECSDVTVQQGIFADYSVL